MKSGWRLEMNQKNFESLLSATRNENVWDIRLAECRAVIEDLTRDGGDFEDIRYGTEKILIQIAHLPSDTMAQTTEDGPGRHRITINTACWETNPNFRKTGLRHVLKHECLHVLTGAGDRDPHFKAEARRRGIDLWTI